MTKPDSPEFIALIPAGGSGSRMGAGLPKQYRPLGDSTMIAQTVRSLLAMDWIKHVYIVVAEADLKAGLTAGLTSARSSCLPLGGASRRDTVLAGLSFVRQQLDRSGSTQPWVMVHDAARPGISAEILNALRQAVVRQVASQTSVSSDGALVAVPIVDTVKREGSSGSDEDKRVGQTLDRKGLWLAQTPQVFPLDPLIAALLECPQATDEASAMEKQGACPVLVPGHWHNMKITLEQDLELIQQVLALQAGAGELPGMTSR